MANANLPEGLCVSSQGSDELFRWRGGELEVERLDEKMSDAEVADQGDFVMSRCNEVGRGLRTQYFGRVGIEGNDDRPAGSLAGMTHRSRNDGMMPKVEAVKGADGEKDRTRDAVQFWNRSQDLHYAGGFMSASAVGPVF